MISMLKGKISNFKPPVEVIEVRVKGQEHL